MVFSVSGGHEISDGRPDPRGLPRLADTKPPVCPRLSLGIKQCGRPGRFLRALAIDAPAREILILRRGTSRTGRPSRCKSQRAGTQLHDRRVGAVQTTTFAVLHRAHHGSEISRCRKSFPVSFPLQFVPLDGRCFLPCNARTGFRDRAVAACIRIARCKRHSEPRSKQQVAADEDGAIWDFHTVFPGRARAGRPAEGRSRP